MLLAHSQHVRIKALPIFLEAAAAKLRESLDPDFQAQLKKEILVEVTTKRFEYTFEGLWKCLKEILIEEGVQTVSPLNCFQEAFRLGLIPKKYEEVFPVMVKKRNEIVPIRPGDFRRTRNHPSNNPGIIFTGINVSKKIPTDHAHRHVTDYE